MKTARQLLRHVTNRLHPDLGCSDGGCVFGHAGGMRTYGGCVCLNERDPILLRRDLLALSEVARALATMCQAESVNEAHLRKGES